MTAWIVGSLTVAFWVLVLAFAFRWIYSNSQNGRFLAREKAETAELARAGAAGDEAAMDAAFRRLTKTWPYVGSLHMQYGEFLEKQRRFDEAVVLLAGYVGRARHIVDENVRVAAWERYLLVRILHKAGRLAEAERTAVKSLRKPHMPVHLSFLFAEIARDRGDEATALQRFSDTVAHYPKEVAAVERYAMELLVRGQADDAEEALRAGMRRIDRAQPLAVLYAQMASDRGDWADAVARWTNVRENYVFYKDAYLKNAVALRALGREAEADAVLASRPRSVGDLDD
jgi:tetratricopeptide (TPR) repeat protein